MNIRNVEFDFDILRAADADRFQQAVNELQAAAAADQAAPVETLALKHIDFRVWYYDKADLQALREFLTARGLRYGRVPAVTQPTL